MSDTINIDMARGCPYYKLGHKSVRFDMDEVRDWVKQKHRRRRGGEQ